MKRLASMFIVLAIAAPLCLAETVAEVALHQRQARTSPEWITRCVMYQIQPRAFTPEGTLKAAEARLPKLAELGVTVVYLCSVCVADDDMNREFWSPRQKKSGMNNPRNPYRLKDYYHIDPEYGTDQDLKDFVAAAHVLKMRVMLDMVYNHCGPTAVFLKDHPDFVERDKNGNIIFTEFYHFLNINFGNSELREYLWRNMEYWVKDFGVDGFRCDYADAVPLDFWEISRARLEKIKPDISMLADGDRITDQLKAFDLDYMWKDAFSAWNDAAAIRKLWEKKVYARPNGAKFIWFIDDINIAQDLGANRIEKQWGFKRVNAALVWLFTIRGVPVLYNGQEVADTAHHSMFGRLESVDWKNGGTPAGKARFAFCQKLCSMRLGERVLTQGEVTWLDNDCPHAVLSYLRVSGKEEILTVINLTGQPVKVKLERVNHAFKTLLADGAQGNKDVFELKEYGFFVGKN